MPRRHVQKLTARLQPAIDRVTRHPFVQRYFPALAHPDLWHLNRRSAARAVAVGLFCGLIPGPLQVGGSMVFSMVFRANFPLAMVTTLYTNPFTIVPLYVIAYQYGGLFLPDVAPMAAFTPPDAAGAAAWLSALSAWMLELGKPLALGLVLLASTLALAGWALVSIGWRWHIVRSWRNRSRHRVAA